jgi:hypothetical protein
MRHIVVLVAAAFLLAGLFIYAYSTVFEIESAAQDRLREKQRLGELPPDLELRDVGMQLPKSEMRKLQIAKWMIDFWFIWGLGGLVLCLGVTVIMQKKNQKAA